MTSHSNDANEHHCLRIIDRIALTYVLVFALVEILANAARLLASFVELLQRGPQGTGGGL